MSPAMESLSWRIKRRSGFTAVELYGIVDERADFSELAQQLSGVVVLELGSITRINSVGVREWIRFITGLPEVTELTLSHCSPAIVNQLNMIANFRGPGRIRSFYAPYVCGDCDHEEDRLIDLEADRPSAATLPTGRCPRCGQDMTLDDLAERYLAFLED
jgi:hypothetical protein